MPLIILLYAWNHITTNTINHFWEPRHPQLIKRLHKRQHQEDLVLEAVESFKSMQTPNFCDVDEEQMQKLITGRRNEVNVKEMLDDDERKEEAEQEMKHMRKVK